MKKLFEKNHIILYSVLFAVVLVLCYLTFWRHGLLPIYGIDGAGQYYPVFLYTGRIIREFCASLFSGTTPRFYDLSVALGEDIFGTLNYYGFGDPINVIAAFATKGSGPYLFALSYYLRLYLGGLAFMLYCRRFRLSKQAVVTSAVAFAFCGYGVYAAGMYMQYSSMLYVFPLLLEGCERVLHKEKGKWLLFVFSWYLGLCGFYFTYMVCIFLAVYCCVRACFVYGRKNAAQALRCVLTCALTAGLGLAMSAPVLLPSLSSYLSSDRTSSTALSKLFSLSNYIPSLTRKFVSDVNVMDSMRNYPVLLFAAATFFLKKDGRIIQLRLAVASMLILLYLPITAIVFNGFANPRDRWVFEAQFVLCAAFAVAADRLRECGYTSLVRVMLVLAVFNILLSFWGRYSGAGDNGKDLFITADTARAETSSAVGSSALISADHDLYRVSGQFVSDINGRPKNDGMNSGYFGTFYWLSVVNENTQFIVDEAAGVSNDWRSYGLGNENKYATLAAVKYFVSRDGSAPGGFVKAEEFEYRGETWETYVNEDFRGFSYVTDDAGEYAASCGQCMYSENDFSCMVTEDAGDAYVVTAFPYAKGWKAYINGTAAKTAERSHYLAVCAGDLHKGDMITMRYTSPGFLPGIVTALIAAACFIVLCVYERRRLRERAPEDKGRGQYDTGQ